jgi:hypothetical protein
MFDDAPQLYEYNKALQERRCYEDKVFVFFNFRGFCIFSLLGIACIRCRQRRNPQEPMDSLVLAMSTDNVSIFDGAITIGTVALKRGHP